MEQRIKARIEGTRPLLMHRFNVENESKLKVGKKPIPEEEAKMGLYENENGPFIPSINILCSIIEAGKDAYVQGKGKKTYKEYIKSGLLVHPAEVPLISKSGWTIDLRPVVVKRNRIVRARPRFDDWALEFEIEIIDPEILTPDIVRLLLERAGRYKGLGDFRPFFGTFKVVEFTIL